MFLYLFLIHDKSKVWKAQRVDLRLQQQKLGASGFKVVLPGSLALERGGTDLEMLWKKTNN